jgi:hypothetical protein
MNILFVNSQASEHCSGPDKFHARSWRAASSSLSAIPIFCHFHSPYKELKEIMLQTNKQITVGKCILMANNSLFVKPTIASIQKNALTHFISDISVLCFAKYNQLECKNNVITLRDMYA